jgi:Hemolysin coregulated protein Hcp (TssD)
MAAKLKIDGSDIEFEVLQMSYSIHQPKDFKTGKPTSEVNSGSINMSVNAGSDTIFVNWAIDSYGKKSGSITVSKFEEEGTMREIKFEDGYLTEFSETVGGNGTLTTSMGITCKKLDINGEVIEKKWN